MSRGYILVVDDEIAILQTLRRALSLEGYVVDVAGGFALAQEKLDKNTYDLLLVDVALPDGDGIQLLEKLRASGGATPTVMMSGHATVDTAVRATRLGASDFLEKPLSTDRLLLVVENTLRLVRAEAEAARFRAQTGFGSELLGSSGPMTELRTQLERAAKANASVLLRGERGTGKELVARAIHRQSKRASAPLEKLNCAAVPEDLIESELFGHEVGAFTGATKLRRGKFERATTGTLFLDEVGDMPLSMQAKLLRVLQEHEIERVGGNETLKVDVRIVAATNRDLEKATEAGAFRADLFDRLNVLPLSLPPLRARREDIPELARHFLRQIAATNELPEPTLSDEAVAALTAYGYPGNVRELRNVIERLVILTPESTIHASDVRTCLGANATPTARGLYRPGVPYRELCEEAERTILAEALRHHDEQMASTARALDLERSHFYKKCKALGLRE